MINKMQPLGVNTDTDFPKESTLFSDFNSQLEQETEILNSITSSIESKLHKFKNTNYPQDSGSVDGSKMVDDVRGNDDLEYELFSTLKAIKRIRIRLGDSLSKLESII